MKDDKFYTKEMGLSYDDVLIVPTKSTVESRLDPNLSCRLANSLILKYPILSSPMSTVTDLNMARVMWNSGGIGVVHRFQSLNGRINTSLDTPMGVAIGLQDSIETCQYIAKFSAFLCVDVAHAYTNNVLKFVEKLKKVITKPIMVGNIVTARAAIELIDAGADILRCNIGSGSVCSTRDNTGIGYPNISSLMEIREVTNFPIIADGGIRAASDICKAIAAGASAVMLGSLLAGTDEAPGEIINGKKQYMGMASALAQELRGGLKPGTVPEGVSVYVPLKGPVQNVIENLMGGLKSSMTYVNARNLTEYYQNTKFVRITQNGLIESKPHIYDRL